MSITEKNNSRRQIPRLLGAVLLIFDIMAIWLGFTTTSHMSGVMVYLSSNFNWAYDFHHFDTRRYYYVFLSVCILLYFVFKGHYSRRIPWLGQMENIFRVVGFTAVLDGFNYYFVDNSSFPFWLIFNWGLCTFYILLARRVAFAIIRRTKSWHLPVVIMGNARMVTDCLHAFSAEKLTGYDVKAILLCQNEGLDFETLPKGASNIHIHNRLESFDAFIEANPDYYYIFSMDEMRGSNASMLKSVIERRKIDFGVVPHTRAFDVFGMEPHYFFGNDVMILHRRESINSPSGKILKRLSDIVISAFFLIPLGIFTAIIWASKKINKSSSPVFYGGKRVGLNGKPFHCWKFNTMREDADEVLQKIIDQDSDVRAEWNKFQKLKNDPRVDSKISRLLRKTSLDELPQLWNVFIGDMSLVGPRPLLESQTEEYGKKFSRYCAVRPGITGLWQVSGRNETSFEQRVYWDDWYIRNWSLWYDVVIFFKTGKVLLTGSGAY